MPQLIVALDSNDDSANYVHILDAKEEHTYYCPCCKGIVRPRAYKKGKKYKVQSHFYHETGGCKEESYVHYICKNWLFETGCKFIVSDTEYTVASIEVEKTLKTNFGDYRPDIIVYTTVGKIFYFEIKFANKKKVDCIPKWDELGNDVVEVDVRYFVNQKYDNLIPTFNLIYSDGNCFIKTYTTRDYDSIIATRKSEWKRQDRINYKMMWERLDWFWQSVMNYSIELTSKVEVLAAFSGLSSEDQIWCYQHVKGKTCVSLKKEFQDTINQNSIRILENIAKEYKDVMLSVKHISPLIYEVMIKVILPHGKYKFYYETAKKVKLQKGLLLFDNTEIKLAIENSLKDKDNYLVRLRNIRKLPELPYVESVRFCGIDCLNYHNVYAIPVIVNFQAAIRNDSQMESIGEIRSNIYSLSKDELFDEYLRLKKLAESKFKQECISLSLKNSCDFHQMINRINTKFHSSSIKDFQLRVDYDRCGLYLYGGRIHILSFYFDSIDSLNKLDEIEKKIIGRIDLWSERYEEILKYVKIINKCNNRLWKIISFNSNSIRLGLCEDGSLIAEKNITVHTPTIKAEILSGMRDLLEYAENYKGIRFLEVR